jgi:hypothetical protein
MRTQMSSEMKQAILFLGASAQHYNPDYAWAAERHQLAVLGAESPSVEWAQSPYLSTAEKEHRMTWCRPGESAALFEAIDGWRRSYRLRGVCALRDGWVETAGLIADALGLPSIGLRASRVCQNKLLQRIYLSGLGPSYMLVRSEGSADSWDKFPAVLKPVTGSGSSGVVLVRSRSEFRSFLESSVGGDGLLIEEYAPGAEFSVESLVQHGKTVFAGLTEKRTNEGSGTSFVELAHTVPAALDGPARESLLAANRTVIDALDVRDGIIHAEFRLTESGDVSLTEVNGRCPGGSIPALYRLATGKSLEEAVLALAIGKPAAYPEPRRWARQVFVEHMPGVLADVRVSAGVRPVWMAHEMPYRIPDYLDCHEPGRLRAVKVAKRRGEVLGQLISNQDRAVTYIIDAPSLAEVDDLELLASETIDIDVEAI